MWVSEIWSSLFYISFWRLIRMAAAKFQRSTDNLVPKIAATKSALFKTAKKKTLQKGNHLNRYLQWKWRYYFSTQIHHDRRIYIIILQNCRRSQNWTLNLTSVPSFFFFLIRLNAGNCTLFLQVHSSTKNSPYNFAMPEWKTDKNACNMFNTIKDSFFILIAANLSSSSI